MEAVKKYWLWGIFISILSIFAMSHNANALVSTFDLSGYALQFDSPVNRLTCSVIDDTTPNLILSGQNYCRYQVGNSAKQGFTSITTTNARSLKAGDIIDFYLVVYTSQSYNGFVEHNLITNQSGQPANIGWNLVDRGEFTDITPISNNGDYSTFGLKQYVYNITQVVGLDGSYNVGLTNSSGVFNSLKDDNLGQYVYVRISNLTIYRPTESKENKEVEEKTQEAVDESQTAGGDSSTSAQTGTTGLLNAITGAVNVIAAAQPTNCKINGNMGNLDIGQLDLCANPAPAFVQTIGSLILILMCVPLAISLFNRFIAIFRSFQS